MSGSVDRTPETAGVGAAVLADVVERAREALAWGESATICLTEISQALRDYEAVLENALRELVDAAEPYEDDPVGAGIWADGIDPLDVLREAMGSARTALRTPTPVRASSPNVPSESGVSVPGETGDRT